MMDDLGRWGEGWNGLVIRGEDHPGIAQEQECIGYMPCPLPLLAWVMYAINLLAGVHVTLIA